MEEDKVEGLNKEGEREDRNDEMQGEEMLEGQRKGKGQAVPGRETKRDGGVGEKGSLLAQVA